MNEAFDLVQFTDVDFGNMDFHSIAHFILDFMGQLLQYIDTTSRQYQLQVFGRSFGEFEGFPDQLTTSKRIRS